MDHGDLPVRSALAAAFERTWDEIGSPGARWTGTQRVEILRAARRADPGATESAPMLPPAARDAAGRIAAAPASITEAWVGAVVDAIGEPEYVELVGVVARVVAVDTFCRLLGLDPPAPPDPAPGGPTNEAVPDNARRNRTWVRMVTPLAPLVLGAVPSAEAAVNDLCDLLYMPPDQIGDAQWRRGLLDRPRVELVAATVSQVNECFYWALSHAGMLSWSATEANQPVDLAAIVDDTREPGFDGGRELIALARAVTETEPDRRYLDAVADELDLAAAVDAAAVAANFQIMNRIVDATGLQVGRHHRQQNKSIIDTLRLDRFPHARD